MIMKILIVDDVPVNLKLLQALLEGEGHEVRSAADGILALEILKRERFDAIISDILMPRMDGYSLCFEVRRSEKLKSIPFIFYTATYTSPADEKLCYELGGDKYLKKPASIEDLRAALDERRKDERRRQVPDGELKEMNVLKEYNQRLVQKLGDKNIQLDAAVQQLEASLQQISLQAAALNAAANPMIITDRTGSISWSNPAFTVLSGYIPKEALGKNPRDLVKSGQVDPSLYKEMWERISSGGTWHGELVNKRKSGTLYTEEMTITPMKNEEGLITHFIAVKLDITERRTAERALQDSELLFRQLAENICEVFFLVDASVTKMFYVSPSYETIWGRSVESLYANPRSFADAIHPDDVQSVFAAIMPEGRLVPFDVEYRILTPDGILKWIRARGFPVPNAAGEIYRFAGTAEDITERKLADTKLKKAYENLKRETEERKRAEEKFLQIQKMEALGQLSGGVAHDFNNLLTVILGGVSLIETCETIPEVMEELGAIKRSGERAAALTRQLLLFSRQQNLMRRRIDLNESIVHITQMLRRIIGEDVRFKFPRSPDALVIYADPGMIDQILMNLSVNARDAMPRGGDLVIEARKVFFDEETAAASGQVQAGWFAILSVSDSGTGIPPEVMPKIFDPFFTTKEIGKGTGLGLATVFSIIQRHEGWINVYSEPGHGSTFRVYLPLIENGTAEGTVAVAAAKASLGQETILLVEDETSIRQMLSKYLRRLGYDVLEAGDGPEALKILEERKADLSLVVTDIRMPGDIDGFELAAMITARGPGIRILYTSGYTDTLAATDIELTEGVNFLAKPYALPYAASTIRAALDRTD